MISDLTTHILMIFFKIALHQKMTMYSGEQIRF